MKSFIRKTLIFLLLFVAVAEILSRLFIDPLYLYSIDTYNLKLKNPGLNVYKTKKTSHVDYLFIGSSRVPATINPDVIMQKEPEKSAIVAGRGYSTPGLHHQALKNRVEEFPAYLMGASVFLEYPGSSIWDNDFSIDQLVVYELGNFSEPSMPHLLIPHLNFKSYKEFIRESDNSNRVKLKMTILYFSSAFRTSAFIKEQIMKFNNPLFNRSSEDLVSEGGIRSDNVESARQKAVEYASIESLYLASKPTLSFEALNHSSLAHIQDIVTSHGGTFYLYKVPLHSLQEEVYHTPHVLENKHIFERWLVSRGILIVDTPRFNYSDADFPDTWHLSESRRDEFTTLLFDSFLSDPAFHISADPVDLDAD